MASVLDPSRLFATEHGTVDWASGGRLHVRLGEREWTFAPEDVRSLHDAVEPLAAQVYRCNCDCRWQLRVGERSTVVLDTDEVLRLHSLLDGAVAMLELYSVLEEASVARSSSACR